MPTSSTWVRVAYPGAGAAWGDQYIPRIGQEVTASFLDNDIDQPLVTDVVYNGTHCPPTFSGAGRTQTETRREGGGYVIRRGHYPNTVFSGANSFVRRS